MHGSSKRNLYKYKSPSVRTGKVSGNHQFSHTGMKNWCLDYEEGTLKITHLWCAINKVMCLHAQPLSHVRPFVTPWTATLLYPWDFPGKNTGVDSHFLLRGIFPDPGMETTSPVLAGGFFTHWATREASINKVAAFEIPAFTF